MSGCCLKQNEEFFSYIMANLLGLDFTRISATNDVMHCRIYLVDSVTKICIIFVYSGHCLYKAVIQNVYIIPMNRSLTTGHDR